MKKLVSGFLVLLLFVSCFLIAPPVQSANAAPKEVKVLSSVMAAPSASVSSSNVALAGSQPPSPYFTDSGEAVSVNAKKGTWLYRSTTLYVNITKVFNKKKTITYFVADVRFKAPEMERVGFANSKKPGRGSAALYKIAKSNQAVLAINGDFMQQGRSSKKGLIMRNGKVYNAVTGRQSRAQTLSFYPNGTLRVNGTDKALKNKLVKAGVKNTFSFGPTLISGGVINKYLKSHKLNGYHPRSAVGMVEPYHYVLIVADGRSKHYSRGMSLTELAQTFKSLGCTVAYNLDGGQSAAMSFMGKNISKYKGSTTAQRHVTDALMFGKSSKVPKK